jgi:predicted phage terminase large subunit-like protein
MEEDEKNQAMRWLGQNDLYFLMRYLLGRADVEREWLFARCREVQDTPDGCLDLWAREHYKSTLITFALTIQDLLNDPEQTFGIFSHTRPIAKAFLKQIKRELEYNQQLKDLYPDILWQHPRKEAPKWSDDDGLIIKRKSNPKESTIEAWGLVDGQPTSKHFSKLVYDDVVTRESVTTPDMIRKTTEAWELSLNLGAEGGAKRYIGTRYHANDTYATMLHRGSVIPRIYAATDDGTPNGEPVFLKKESLMVKRRDMGAYTFASQMLLNPVADETQGFNQSWLETYENGVTFEGMNKYIVIDPANEKKKTSDYTAIFVVALGSDSNYYIADMVRDRLNLTERADALFRLHRKYMPIGVGYEKYGMQSDVQHIKDRMGRENYHFSITELGGRLSKLDRIRRLIPLFESGRVWFPPSMFRTDYEKKTHDLVSVFIEEELKAFPVSMHDDMLDALARITDEELNAQFPMAAVDSNGYKRDRYSQMQPKTRSWQAR